VLWLSFFTPFRGTVTGAIIGVGGFLGVGQKDVVIPFKELKASTRDGKDWLVLNHR
jgi:hypothetical protein